MAWWNWKESPCHTAIPQTIHILSSYGGSNIIQDCFSCPRFTPFFLHMNQHCSLQHLVSCLLFLCDRLGWRIRTWVLLQPGKGSPESCRKLSISISHNGGTVQSVFQGSILHPTVNPNTHTIAPVSSFEKEGTLAAAWLFCVQEANTLESNGFFIHQVNVSRRFGCTPACI